MTPATETADLIVEARRRAGLSQSELAERTGRAQTSIARWERGDAPSLETVREVVEACGLDLQTTLEERDDSYDALVAANLELSPLERVRSALGNADFAPGVIARALAEQRVAYILIGALAETLHGSPVRSDDRRYLIVPAEGEAGVAALARAVESLGAEPRSLGGRRSEADAFESWSVSRALGDLGIVRRPAGTHGYKDLRGEAEPLKLEPRLAVSVPSMRDLIRIAEASPWSADRVRVPALRATRRRELERASESGGPGPT